MPPDAPWVRRARAAGELRVAVAHHWVPGSNAVAQAVIVEGCARMGMTSHVDFYSTTGHQQNERNERQAPSPPPRLSPCSSNRMPSFGPYRANAERWDVINHLGSLGH